jgi:hypothetical protein
MAEFVFLWGKVQDVQLTVQPDSIRRRWTADGSHTSKSTYEVQYKGSFCSFNSKAIWSASAEGKHRFFAWLVVQRKILTADKLLARNWPCDPNCALCEQAPETVPHLILQCVFAREVWVLVSNWTIGLILVPDQEISTENWWNASVQGRSKEEGRRVATVLTSDLHCLEYLEGTQ